MSTNDNIQKTSESRRLFFALWPDKDVIQKIKHHALKHVIDCQGRILEQHNWHITLAYFGSSDSETHLCLEQQAENIQSHPFQFDLQSLGFWKKPKVAWLAPLNVPDVLKQLAFDIQQNLIHCGYEPEKRDYLPHVTLVKNAKTVPAVLNIDPIPWQVDSFCLVESKTSATGAEYRVIKTWNI